MSDSNSKVDSIIKEFLFHSISESQLSDLRNHFENNNSNVTDINNPNLTFFAEIKILGGIQPPFSNDDLENLKSQHTSLLFRNYRGHNYTKTIQVLCD